MRWFRRDKTSEPALLRGAVTRCLTPYLQSQYPGLYLSERIRVAREVDGAIAEQEQFYRSHGYGGLITTEAAVFSARHEDELVGLVRLEPEHGLLVLRGMIVTHRYQRAGIGTRMLRVLETHCEAQDCYLLGHPWLDGFYGQIGFRRIPDDVLPPHLHARLTGYRKKGNHIPMVRSGGHAPFAT